MHINLSIKQSVDLCLMKSMWFKFSEYHEYPLKALAIAQMSPTTIQIDNLYSTYCLRDVTIRNEHQAHFAV